MIKTRLQVLCHAKATELEKAIPAQEDRHQPCFDAQKTFPIDRYREKGGIFKKDGYTEEMNE